MGNKRKVIVTESLLDDVYEIKPHLRVEDVREIEILGHTAEQALLNGFIFSNECFTVRIDGEVAGMFGYSDYEQPKNVAIIWFLGTDKTKTTPREWLVLGRKYINMFLEKYNVIGNLIDLRQTKHIKWLEALGFKFGASYDVKGFKFREFYKTKEN